MYVVASGLKIYACLEPTDMRRSFDGLMGMVQQRMAINCVWGRGSNRRHSRRIRYLPDLAGILGLNFKEARWTCWTS